jgi:hypothetical protein
MLYQGVLTKMQTEFSEPINYYLNLGNELILAHQLLQKKISLEFVGYECLNCKSNETTFRQGFCKSCFFEQPQTADWIMRPELSKAHLDIEERDLHFEKKVQLQPHIVYLANSSNVKVGVTRKTQVPTRWIDQGAQEALEILEVPNRYLAGVAEVALKKFVSDKTNWREMLKGDASSEDLKSWRQKLSSHLPDEVKPYFIANKEPFHLKFPVQQYPEKPKSLNLAKIQNYSGILVGIKGQYLIFDDDTVFNVRSNEGLIVALNVGN